MSSKHRAHRRVRDYNLLAGLAEVFTPSRHYTSHLSQKFFDELFFFGSLRGSKRCILKVDNKLADEGGPRGKFSKRDVLNVQTGIQGQIYEIKIYKQRGENIYYDLRAALGFMLQAMCHAFLRLRQCTSGTSGMCNEMWGEHGAGWAWQDMALAIEDALSDKKFMDLDIPLGRIEMLAENLRMYPAFLTNEQLRKWRIDPKKLARMVGTKSQ